MRLATQDVSLDIRALAVGSKTQSRRDQTNPTTFSTCLVRGADLNFLTGENRKLASLKRAFKLPRIHETWVTAY